MKHFHLETFTLRLSGTGFLKDVSFRYIPHAMFMCALVHVLQIRMNVLPTCTAAISMLCVTTSQDHTPAHAKLVSQETDKFVLVSCFLVCIFKVKFCTVPCRPQQGTWWSYIILNTRTGQNVTLESEFLRCLQSSHTFCNVMKIIDLHDRFCRSPRN